MPEGEVVIHSSDGVYYFNIIEPDHTIIITSDGGTSKTYKEMLKVLYIYMEIPRAIPLCIPISFVCDQFSGVIFLKQNLHSC
jgi:hypothetical protein